MHTTRGATPFLSTDMIKPYLSKLSAQALILIGLGLGLFAYLPASYAAAFHLPSKLSPYQAIYDAKSGIFSGTLKETLTRQGTHKGLPRYRFTSQLTVLGNELTESSLFYIGKAGLPHSIRYQKKEAGFLIGNSQSSLSFAKDRVIDQDKQAAKLSHKKPSLDPLLARWMIYHASTKKLNFPFVIVHRSNKLQKVNFQILATGTLPTFKTPVGLFHSLTLIRLPKTNDNNGFDTVIWSKQSIPLFLKLMLKSDVTVEIRIRSLSLKGRPINPKDLR